jgi:hypothetical protein
LFWRPRSRLTIFNQKPAFDGTVAELNRKQREGYSHFLKLLDPLQKDFSAIGDMFQRHQSLDALIGIPRIAAEFDGTSVKQLVNALAKQKRKRARSAEKPLLRLISSLGEAIKQLWDSLNEF